MGRSRKPSFNGKRRRGAGKYWDFIKCIFLKRYMYDI
jgi:hypothetical protein